MNVRIKRFIKGYLSHGIGSQAVIDAGYSTKWPGRYAHNLLNRSDVQAEIEKVRKKMDKVTPLAFEYKLDLLKQGIEGYMSTGDYDKAGRLIEIANKMQGHNAVEKHENKLIVNHEDAIKELE